MGSTGGLIPPSHTGTFGRSVQCLGSIGQTHHLSSLGLHPRNEVLFFPFRSFLDAL